MLIGPTHINRLVCSVVRRIFVFSFDIDLMRLFVRLALLACFTYLLAACHRPIAYVQRTPHGPAARLSVAKPTPTESTQPDSGLGAVESMVVSKPVDEPAVASLTNQPATGHPSAARIERRMNRIQSLLTTPASNVDKQPRPKPKQKLKLGNQIREKLGVPLRKELNWWQRISWKLKASVIVIAVALLFAIMQVTILAIIFGILGAFLLITGLKKSMKVRRPWF
jgi:hypothetical protein